MNQYVVGVDGGGTKTDAVLMDISGNLIGMATGGSSNYQAVGGAKLKEEILGCLTKLCHSTNVVASRIGHVFLGLAGAGREKDQLEIADLFRDSEYAGKVTVDSDAMVALAGAFGTGPGIIIISGTGSICFGKNREGQVLRSGGWGYLLGDEGSGYFIGREGLLAALKDFDGRGEKTKLLPRLQQHFQLQSIDQIIPLIYQNKIDRVAIADLTPIVLELARAGDSVAEAIVHLAGRELGKLAKAVAQRLNFGSEEICIALIGSVFKQKELLIGEIAKELYDLSWNVQIGEPRLGPKYGAALLALQKIGVAIDERILKNLEYSIGLMAGRS